MAEAQRPDRWQRSPQASSKPEVCIIHTGSAMPQMLLGEASQHVGGAELQLAEIGRGLCWRDWLVSFAVRDWGESDLGVTYEGIRLIRLKIANGGMPVLRFFTNTLPANLRLLARANAHVYLMRGIGWQTGLLAWHCRRDNRRFVLWLACIEHAMGKLIDHSARAPWERWLARYGLRHADVIVAQTRDQQRLLREHQGLDSVLIRNIWAVDEGRNVPPADPPEVFWAASVQELKRPDIFLEVAQKLKDIRFCMAAAPAPGKDQLYQDIRAEAAKIPNVDFLGFVPFREIDKYYARASAYLCTSTVEGFPNTFLQAWSHGRPVVSTFDPDEVICEHNLGFHCQDLDELVSAVRTACENSSDYAERVRTYLRRYHSPEVIMPQVERVLLGE